MTIEISEKLVGLWFIDTIPRQQDWMCGVVANDDGTYKIDYRFRYHSPVGDGDPFNDEDVKNWYGGIVREQSREEVITTMRRVGEAIAKKAGQKLHEVLLVDGDMERFVRELQRQGWMTSVIVPVTPDVPEGKWRCQCDALNEIIYGACDACGRPMTDTYPVVRKRK